MELSSALCADGSYHNRRKENDYGNRIYCDEVGNNMYSLEDHGDWDGVEAWAAMPKYKGGDGDA